MTTVLPSTTGGYVAALRNAVNEQAADLTIRLRADAIEAGWPDRIASQVSVIADGVKLRVTAPDSVAAEVMEYEYGTSNRAPMPAIRRLGLNTSWAAGLVSRTLKRVSA